MEKIGELLSDEESVRQLSELAQMMMNGSDTTDEPSEQEEVHEEEIKPDGGGIDIGMIMKIGEIMNAMKSQDKNTQLLLALKPHLKAEKQNRIDKAIRFLRLSVVMGVIKDSGMLKELM
jgi:hypothetical protein